MLSIDTVAHGNHWRSRSLTEKNILALGMMAIAIGSPPLPAAPLILIVMTAVALLGAKIPVKLWLACITGTLGFILAGSLSLVVHLGPDGLGLATDGLAAASALTLKALAGFTCLQFLALT
ncbi:MAG: hypothetical protein HQL73_12755, partial [Magnetococcales bacterium]|nr:hypothetical protein [Magnetococcales bacterium]